MRKAVVGIVILTIVAVIASYPASVLLVHASPKPGIPSLEGPYYGWTKVLANPNNLVRGDAYGWASHTAHVYGYGLHYQFDWGVGAYQNFWIPYDNDMPWTTHTWYTGGYYWVRVRACCYDRSTGLDCGDWTYWRALKITVYPFGNIE